MGRDTNHYQYDSYTTGRKQDYGHHELNDENGWVCFEWDRGDYTETMEMKKPLDGKGWKPFRVYTYASTFEDFLTVEEAQAYFDERTKLNFGYAHFIEVDKETGKEIRKIDQWPRPVEPVKPPEPEPLKEADLKSFIVHISDMLLKEKSHLQFLENHKDVTEVDVIGMIARSKFMVEHLTTRLQEYKDYLTKHYGEPATTDQHHRKN